MTSENSAPPDIQAAPVGATRSADSAKSQRDGATDNDVIIAKTAAGIILAITYTFKDEIKNGIKDLFRRLKKVGPFEFFPPPDSDTSKKE